jgi:hypothetical protein
MVRWTHITESFLKCTTDYLAIPGNLLVCVCVCRRRPSFARAI